jgi:hypothetical protein
MLQVLSRARRNNMLDTIEWALKYEEDHPDKNSFDPKLIARQLFERHFGPGALAQVCGPNSGGGFL